MSSRRKSSVPSVVRVSGDPPQEQVEVRETRNGPQPTAPDAPDQQDHPRDPRPEPLEGPEEDRQEPPAVPEDAGGAEDRRGPKKKGRSFCPLSWGSLRGLEQHVDSSHPSALLHPPSRSSNSRFDSLGEHGQRQHPGERRAPEGEAVAALSINGTLIIPEAGLLQGLSHVSPLLQRPPNVQAVPKMAVPLHTARYHPSLDHNATLITSFNQFPYPTHAELSWLTAASRHPEEQIRVWFTTQRLKQGITWSPEEVEEARKKMFNGCAPPAHHAITVPPSGPSSHARVGGAVTPNGCAGGPGPTHKRPHLTPVFGPEPKRPFLPVAPHSADDKILMAPPPPPPQKERLPVAPPPVPTETKRAAAVPAGGAEVQRPSAGVPLTPSSSPSPKGKLPSALGSAKTKPVVSLPSMVFPESLTTPMIAPPPLAAPPFKNSLLIPLSSALASKDQPPSTLAADAPLIAPHTRRPPVIQAARAPPKAPPRLPGFPPDGASDRPWAPDGSWPPGDLRPAVLSHFPLLERMRGKTGEQLKVLEENFLRNSLPAQSDLDGLAGATQLSQQEISGWFAERRALRDNLEQALLGSMGAKRMAAGGLGAPNETNQQLNGIHKAPPPRAPPPGPSTPSVSSSCPVPPDRQAAALLRDSSAPPPWPSPEEPGQEPPPGPAPPDLRLGHRLRRAGAELVEHFHRNGQGPPPGSSDHLPAVLVQRCQGGGVATNSRETLEAEFGRPMEQRANQEEDGPRHQFTDSGPQTTLELNGGVLGGAPGSWLEDGPLQGDRTGDPSRRLTG